MHFCLVYCLVYDLIDIADKTQIVLIQSCIFCLFYGLLYLRHKTRQQDKLVRQKGADSLERLLAPFFFRLSPQGKRDVASQNDVLEALNTNEVVTSTGDLAKELNASREGTRKQLTTLREKGHVEGDGQRGRLLTDAGRKALEVGGAHPSMTDQADIRDDLRRVWVNS